MRSVLALVALIPLIAACGADQVPPAPQADSVTVTDQWAKAAPATGMTAVFGNIHNASDSDARIVSATSPAARSVELHEVTADGVMRPKQGGILVASHGEHLLEPGGDHLMLMDLTTSVQAGHDVTVTLKFSDSSQISITAQTRDFAGANENYGH